MARQPKSAITTRVYRSALREQQAIETRARVIAPAAELFSSEGYARTTFGKIAAAAGVSAETVQLHGPKANRSVPLLLGPSPFP